MSSTKGTLASGDYSVGGGEVDVVAVAAAPFKATYTYYFNTANMQDGDVINLRVKMRANAEAVQVVSQGDIVFSDIEDDRMVTTFPVVVEEGDPLAITFEQTAGTVRDWEWRLADVKIYE